MTQLDKPILVIGGTGKTGRRVVQRLEALGLPTRAVSRSTSIPFDWSDAATWDGALEGISHAYVTYSPDLALPEAPPAIAALARKARERGIERLVLLSGRGEEEAQRCEQIVQGVNARWTVVRASWFAQNFSEGFLVDMVNAGSVHLPAGDVPEPFVDADDIADVVVAALTESGHEGRIYEVTGSRMLTFAEAVAELSEAVGRPVTYQQIPADAFEGAMRAMGTPPVIVGLTRYLFETVLDGRNAHVTPGVQQALGRPARDFSEYLRTAVASGAWSTEGS
ncbi:MAG: NmrA family NAD(P)-binding protein [Myxococcota bacterium]